MNRKPCPKCGSKHTIRTLEEFANDFPSKVAAARALDVDQSQLRRWIKAEALMINGVIYNKRKRDK